MRTWKSYLKPPTPRPTDADRVRVEALAGARLPDRYWHLVCEHQGKVLEAADPELDDEDEIRLGVLLLALSPDAVSNVNSTYCIEDCFKIMQGRYPAGLFPFADDTGGNFWAFDLRGNDANPAIVFLHHERMGEENITRVADSFGAFMALADVE